MEKYKLTQNIFIYTLITILFIPFLILAFQMPFGFNLNWDDLVKVLLNNFFIAILSGLFTVIFSLTTAYFIFPVVLKSETTNNLLLLPTLLPSLFTIQLLMQMENLINLTTIWDGIWVVLGSFIICNGLVIISFSYSLQKIMLDYSLLKNIYCLKEKYFLFILIKSLKFQIFTNFFYVFIFSFSIFSIPYFFSQSGAQTIEVYLYELIRENNWKGAWIVSIIQYLILSLLILMFNFKNSKFDRQIKKNKSYTNHSQLMYTFLSLSLFPSFLMIFSFISKVYLGFDKFVRDLTILWVPTFIALKYTLVLMTFSVISICLLLFLLFYSWPSLRQRKFLLSYSNPSIVLIGFSLLILISHTSFRFTLFWLSLGLCISFFPYLYKSFVYPIFISAQEKYLLARIYKINFFKFFLLILLPNYQSSFYKIILLTILWTAGDFSLSMLLLDNDITLSLLAKSFLSSYHFELSTIYLLFMLITAFAYYFLIRQFIAFFMYKYKQKTLDFPKGL